MNGSPLASTGWYGTSGRGDTPRVSHDGGGGADGGGRGALHGGGSSLAAARRRGGARPHRESIGSEPTYNKSLSRGVWQPTTQNHNLKTSENKETYFFVINKHALKSTCILHFAYTFFFDFVAQAPQYKRKTKIDPSARLGTHGLRGGLIAVVPHST